MYEVYCDGKLMQNFDIKGLCLVNPVLDLEVNKVGKFEFDIYPDHPYYNFVKKQKSIVVIKCKGKIVFRGRVLDDESGMFNQKHVMCEGEMAFLNDSIQRPYDFFTGDKHTTVSELFTFLLQIITPK